MDFTSRIRSGGLLLAMVLLAFPLQAAGQDFQLQPPQFGNLGDLPGGFPGLENPEGGGGEITLSGEFTAEKDGNQGILKIKAVLAPGWHVYSLTQPPGGPLKSRITAKPNEKYSVGEFTPNHDPEIVQEKVYPGLDIEQHEGEVVWSAPVKLADGIDPGKLAMEIIFDGLICKDACIPVSKRKVEIRFAGYYEVPKVDAGYRAAGSHAQISGYVEPGEEDWKLVLTAAPDPNWHVYPLAKIDSGKGSKPTLIVVEEAAGLQAGRPVASSQPITEKDQTYHEGPVTWIIDLGKLPADYAAANVTIAGQIGYQTCEKSCDFPTAARFQATVPAAATAETIPLEFSPAKYNDVAELAQQRSLEEVVVVEPVKSGELALNLVFAFLGGIILNLMPCVLPVIGLKILSFAEQAGKDRMKVLLMNLWYTAGLISVFLLIATAAAFLNFKWGEQFTKPWFMVPMSSLVFVMALSFLGVWEMPIPGFVGGGKASELQSMEGGLGAFFKGVFTTLLATPCSAPLLGVAFGYTLGKPPIVVYAIFGTAGLGMASPYLITGLFPQFVKFIPAPGDWMETFKELMAFFLLGTVVFLFSSLQATGLVLPTLTFLIGLWFACWWIGRLSALATLWQKFTVWIGAISVAAVVGIFAFKTEYLFAALAILAALIAARLWLGTLSVSGDLQRKIRHIAGAAGMVALVGILGVKFLVPQKVELPWQPYSQAALAEAQASGKTVLVDFTAQWCANCKWNLAWAINTHKVKSKVESNEVVTLLADWSDGSTEIGSKIAELKSASIPLLAIYPAGSPQQPIVLRDLLTESQVLSALETAGPSQSAATSEVASRRNRQPQEQRE